jgi:hypothetical protein
MDLALAAADQALATAYRRGDVDEEDPRRRQRMEDTSELRTAFMEDMEEFGGLQAACAEIQ